MRTEALAAEVAKALCIAADASGLAYGISDMRGQPRCSSVRLKGSVAALLTRRVVLAVFVVLGACAALEGYLPLARCQYKPPRKPPGPLAIRERTNKLRDKWTNLPRLAPKEADEALDYFQRTFPSVTTEEHLLIERWEELASLFGGIDAATELVLLDPSVLRVQRQIPRRAYHFLCLYLGPTAARQVVYDQPYVLTRKGGQMRKTLPALLNVFGTKKKLAEICVKYPSLLHVPIGDFYRGMPDMNAVCGSPTAAMEVATEAMDRIRRSPILSLVPECYPTLIAIFGGLAEAHAAIDQEPLLLKWEGSQFLGRLGRLRQLVGREGAQEALKKAPYLLLHENQRKSRKMQLAFDALERIFGRETTETMAKERPELLALGGVLKRALRFAERKLGSPEAIAVDFEGVLNRTGLLDHLEWEMKPRPRHGIWTPASKVPNYGFNHTSWSPHMNPTGRAGPARGRWDLDEGEEEPEKATAQVVGDEVGPFGELPDEWLDRMLDKADRLR